MRWLALAVAFAVCPALAAPVPSPRPTIWYADWIDERDGRTFVISNEGEPKLLIICKSNQPAGVMYRPIRGLEGTNGLTPVGYVLNTSPRTPHVNLWFAQDGSVIPSNNEIAPVLIRRLAQSQKVAFYITKDGNIDHGWIFDVSGIAAHRDAIRRNCRMGR